MHSPGHLNELTEKLKERTASQALQVEQTVQTVLSDLSESLRRSAEKELTTIRNDMDDQIRQLRQRQSATFRYHWKQNLWANLLSALFLAAMATAITGFTTWRVKSLSQDVSRLTTEIARLKSEESKIQTWGLQLVSNKQGAFIILPKGVKPKIGWEMQGQARRLDQQDVRLTALERQVKGCQDLQNELEQVLRQLADFSRRWRK